MRLLLILASLTLPVAASAQFAPRPRVPSPGGPPPFVGSVGQTAPGSWRETRDIRDRVGDGRRSGQLTRREAAGLRKQAGFIDRLAARYAADGLSEAEIRELAVRTQILRDETIARRSGFRRDER